MVNDSTVFGNTAGGYSGNAITIDVSMPKVWSRLVDKDYQIFSAHKSILIFLNLTHFLMKAFNVI